MLIQIIACAPNKPLTRNSFADINFMDSRDESDEFFYKDYENENKHSTPSFNREKRDEDWDKKNIQNYNNRNRQNKTNEYSQRKNKIPQKFFQTGKVSWYGREFHGRITASGEKFNMYKNTAAHKTLPFGSILQAKNLKNGKTVNVRINDRGPYKEDRIIDLSYASAKKLDIVNDGDAMIGIKILHMENGGTYFSKTLGDDEIEPVAGEGSIIDKNYLKNRLIKDSAFDNYSIQTGAFYSIRNAKNLKKRLEELFENPIVIHQEGDMYKVRIEGIKTNNEARRYKWRLEEDNFPAYIMYNQYQ